MKELTIEQKAKAYDEAIEKARLVLQEKGNEPDGASILSELFPELIESEDERIRKEMIEILRKEAQDFPSSVIAEKSNIWIAWLEKQGEQKSDEIRTTGYWNVQNIEQKPVNKVEPKFHKGDWIIHQGTDNVYQVVAIINKQYQLKYGNSYTFQECADVDKCARLWDITKDAKDGDVLSYRNGQWIFIYKEKIDDKSFYYHALYSTVQGLTIANTGFTLLNNAITPATKEQRDTLMKAMDDDGYTFDFKKKELKKIYKII